MHLESDLGLSYPLLLSLLKIFYITNLGPPTFRHKCLGPRRVLGEKGHVDQRRARSEKGAAPSGI